MLIKMCKLIIKVPPSRAVSSRASGNAPLDPNSLNNFRPVSNLPFLSKILEKLVFIQLNGFFSNKNNILEKYQSVCFVVLEGGVSTDKVWQQIDKLHKKTGIPKEEFKPVLPLSDKDPPSSLFKIYTFEDVQSDKVNRLIEERDPMASKKRKSSSNKPEQHSHQERGNKGSSKKPKISGETVNLVLVGMAGTGKSASGNTILGEKIFVSRPSSKQVTTVCEKKETEIYGIPVRVIDTPDIFDDDNKDAAKEVTGCKELCRSDPCVYLLVMQVGRFTDSERDVLTKLEAAFGNRIHEQTIILFTCGEELERAQMTLDGFLCSCQSDLKKLVEKCGDRCVLFENRASDLNQVEELMKKVKRLLNIVGT